MVNISLVCINTVIAISHAVAIRTNWLSAPHYF